MTVIESAESWVNLTQPLTLSVEWGSFERMQVAVSVEEWEMRRDMIVRTSTFSKDLCFMIIMIIEGVANKRLFLDIKHDTIY